MKEQLAFLDSLNINLGAGEMFVVNCILAFVMFGVALGIKFQMFKDVFKNPKSVILGILLQWVMLPAITSLLAIVLNPIITPMVAIGMILVASCPGGNISNFITSLSRGNTELSVSLTAINTAACIFTTPINFSFWGGMYLRFAERHDLVIPELSIPFWEIFKTIVILLGIPLVLGMLCSQYLPKISQKLKKPMQYLSVAFFIVMVVLTFGNNIDAFMKCIKYIFLVVLVHNLLALGIGFGTGSLFKTPYKDRRTLTIETGIQNSGLGLALLFNPAIFDPTVWSHNGGMIIITALWGVWHIVSGLSVATTFRNTNI